MPMQVPFLLAPGKENNYRFGINHLGAELLAGASGMCRELQLARGKSATR